MKIVCAPDSFKESLSAHDAAQAIAAGVHDVIAAAEVVLCPMADGGEGTVEAVVTAVGGELRACTVRGADGQRVSAQWGWLPGNIAVIEVAASVGLAMIAPARREPLRADSHGVGEMIVAALDAGAQEIILGLGGSSSTDAGAGMLRALGLRIVDEQGQDVGPGGSALQHAARVDVSGLDPRLKTVTVTVASDVDNPLCGPHGASAIFGPQKGANAEQVKTLDDALDHFARLCAQATGRDASQAKGAGAAGGLGFAALTFLDGRFRAGVDVVAELNGLEKALQSADLVFTGEGKLDAQTLHGKTPAGVARLAKQAGVPVVALAGMLGEGYEALYPAGLTAAFSLASGPMSLSQACEQAATLLRQRTGDVMRLWMHSRQLAQA